MWFNLRENGEGKEVVSREQELWHVITDGLDLVDKDIVDFLTRSPVRAVDPRLHASLLLTSLSERAYLKSSTCVLYLFNQVQCLI